MTKIARRDSRRRRLVETASPWHTLRLLVSRISKYPDLSSHPRITPIQHAKEFRPAPGYRHKHSACNNLVIIARCTGSASLRRTRPRSRPRRHIGLILRRPAIGRDPARQRLSRVILWPARLKRRWRDRRTGSPLTLGNRWRPKRQLGWASPIHSAIPAVTAIPTIPSELLRRRRRRGALVWRIRPVPRAGSRGSR